MWNERYAEPGYVYGTSPNDFLARIEPLLPAGPILSIAEGEGRNAVFLATRGHEVHAVDASHVGLDKAKQLALERNVPLTTEVADLATYDFGVSRWAAIVSIFCHLPPSVRERCHTAIVRALLPGGMFACEVCRPAQLRFGTGGPQLPRRPRCYGAVPGQKSVTLARDSIRKRFTVRSVLPRVSVDAAVFRYWPPPCPSFRRPKVAAPGCPADIMRP